MAAEPDRLVRYEEYCDLERAARVKHEYWHGRLFAMAGGTLTHAAISRNILAMLTGSLAGTTCAPYGSDLRVRIDRMDVDTYPDILVICGPPRFAARTEDCVTNPKVIFEVLSPSSERSDRGEKFECYAALPSLDEYVLVSQDRCRVEVFRRQPEGRWLLEAVNGIESMAMLESLQLSLPLAAIYAGISLPDISAPITRQ